MNDIIQIQYPGDGAILSIKNQPGLEHKSVTCPVCKQSRPFTQYKRFVPKTEECTDYPNKHGGSNHQHGNTENTNYAMENLCIGRLTVTATGKKYSLQPGRNVIGRKSSASEANIQIETGESRRMSRMHLVIEVVKVPGKGYVHQASLFKDKCNATYINSAQLEPGDCIVLHHCDVLRLPDVDLKFEIPEGDETDF